MPRRTILSTVEHESLLALPDDQEELLRRYAFSESDLAIIRQRRGPSNRLGFAVLLCYLRYPGVVLGADEPPFPPLLRLVAEQLNSIRSPLGRLRPTGTDAAQAPGRTAGRLRGIGLFPQATPEKRYPC